MKRTILILAILLLAAQAWAFPLTPPYQSPANVGITGGTITGTTVTVSDYQYIPVDACSDGTAAPDAATELSSTNKARVRNFLTASDSDVFCSWNPPADWNGGTVTFNVDGWISNATAPAQTETVNMVLACGSYGNSDILSTALGSGITATFTAPTPTTYVQYDRWSTGYSSAVTIANAAAGETIICNLKRDSTDSYKQKVGVAGFWVKFTRTLSP